MWADNGYGVCPLRSPRLGAWGGIEILSNYKAP